MSFNLELSPVDAGAVALIITIIQILKQKMNDRTIVPYFTFLIALPIAFISVFFIDGTLGDSGVRALIGAICTKMFVYGFASIGSYKMVIEKLENMGAKKVPVVKAVEKVVVVKSEAKKSPSKKGGKK